LSMTITNGAGGTALSGTVSIRTTDGTVLYSESAGTYTSGVARTITLSNYLNIAAGATETIEVIADVSSTATSSDSYVVTLTNWYGKRITSNTFFGPTASPITGNTLTVGTGGISVSKNQAFANGNVVAGSSEVKVGSFIFQATSNEDVNVTSITIDGTGSTPNTTLANGYSNLKLKKEDGTQLGNAIPSPTATDTFSISGFTVSAGSSEIVDAYVTISSSGTNTDTILLGVSAVTAIGATSQSSVTTSGLTATGQTMTVGLGGTLTVALDSTATAAAALLHSAESNAHVVTAKFTANNFEDITINDITVAIQNGDANVSKASLYDSSGALIAGPTSIINGEVSFSGINKVVQKNKTVSLYIKVNTTSSGTMKSALSIKAGIVYVKATGAGGLITYSYVAGTETADATGLANTYNVGDVAIYLDGGVTAADHTIGMITTAGSGTTARYLADGTAIAAVVTPANSDVLSLLPTVSTETATGATGVKYSYAVGDAVMFKDASVASGTNYLGIVSATTPTIHTTAGANTAIANGDQITKLPSTQTETFATAFSNSYGIGDVAVYYDAGTGTVLAMYTAADTFTSLGDGGAAITEAAGDIITTLPKVHSETVSATADKYYYAGDPVVIYDSSAAKVYLGHCTTSGYANTGGTARFAWNSGAAAALAVGDIVTKLKGFGSVGNSMRMYDVEPTVTFGASPSGSTTPQANQTVGNLVIKADGDVDLEISQLRLTKSGTNEPYRYVTNYGLYLGGTQIARVNQSYIEGLVTTGDITAQKTITLDTGAQGAGSNTVYAVAAGECNGFKVGDDVYIEIFDAATPTTIVTTYNTTITALTACTSITFADAITVDESATDTIRITNKNVTFDSNTNNGTNGQAMALQTITAGNTVTYEVKADTSAVKTGVTTQSVTFSIYLDGTAGSTGDLVWQFDPIGGTANTSGGTYSDSYPAYGNTLTY